MNDAADAVAKAAQLVREGKWQEADVVLVNAHHQAPIGYPMALDLMLHIAALALEEA